MAIERCTLSLLSTSSPHCAKLFTVVLVHATPGMVAPPSTAGAANQGAVHKRCGSGRRAPGTSRQARGGTTPVRHGVASGRRPGCRTLESTAEGPGHHGTGREGGVRSLRALTPRLVYMAEPGKNKIWGSQTARAFLLQSEQPQLEQSVTTCQLAPLVSITSMKLLGQISP